MNYTFYKFGNIEFVLDAAGRKCLTLDSVATLAGVTAARAANLFPVGAEILVPRGTPAVAVKCYRSTYVYDGLGGLPTSTTAIASKVALVALGLA